MFNMFDRTAQKGRPTSQIMSDSLAIFSGLWGLFMACC